MVLWVMFLPFFCSLLLLVSGPPVATAETLDDHDDGDDDEPDEHDDGHRTAVKEPVIFTGNGSYERKI